MDVDHLVVIDADVPLMGFLLKDVRRLDPHPSGDGVLLDLQAGALLMALAESHPVDLNLVVTDRLGLFDHSYLHAVVFSGTLFPSTTYSAVRNNVRLAFVRAAAEKALKAGDVREPPVPVEDVARTYALTIVEGKVPNGWGYFHPASWSICLSEALFRETPQNRNRRRFTLAHELGHCLLEHGEMSCWNLGISAEPTDLSELDDVPDTEQEAHQFARELLLPRQWLARDWAKEPKPERWALTYGVSTQTLFIVLMERRLLMRTGKRR